MSAQFQKRDGFINSPGYITKTEWTILETMFDQQVDEDIHEYKVNKKETKIFRQVALVKLITFPFVYLVTAMFMDKYFRDDVWLTVKACWKFFRRKTTTKQFKAELTAISERPQDDF